MPQPIKLGKINFSSVSLQENVQLSRMQDAINTLGGYSGEIELQNHVNLNGNRIKNVGTAVEENDATSLSTTESRYSSSAIRPKLEAAGETPLRTYITSLKGDVTASAPGSASATVVSITGVTLDEISGNLELTQLPTSGVSSTVTLAALTSGGTKGSLTIQHGLITSVTQPT